MIVAVFTVAPILFGLAAGLGLANGPASSNSRVPPAPSAARGPAPPPDGATLLIGPKAQAVTG